MNLFPDDMPKPIIIDGLRQINGRRRTTAGTKVKCELCGRPTYRTMGTHYVCSMCSSKPESKQFDVEW